MNLEDLKSELAMGDMKHDPYGTMLNWHFQVADELYRREAYVPDAWGYSPGLAGPDDFDPENFTHNTLSMADDETLVDFGDMLKRATAILVKQGRSY